MWNLLKGMKGKKFQTQDNCTLWHTIEKTEEEAVNSRKISVVAKALREHIVEKGIATEEMLRLALMVIGAWVTCT